MDIGHLYIYITMELVLSDLTTTVLIFIVTALSTKYLYVILTQKLPPGPWGVPILGYLPWMKDCLPLTLDKLAHKYGPIFSVSTGRNYTVFLSSPELIKEAFWKESLTGRPTNAVLNIFDGFGITNTGGSLWKSERRFLHVQLRKLGMTSTPKGSQEIEKCINVELGQFMKTLDSFEGKPCSIDEDIRHLTTNILSNILMSVRFDKDHPFYQKIEQLHESGFMLYAEADHYTKFPGMTRLPGFEAALLKLKANHDQESDLIRSFIENKRKSFVPEDKPANIIDAYLLEEHKNKVNGQNEASQGDYDQQLCQVLLDLYSGGSETVATILHWAFLLLMQNPEAAMKVQSEIDSVVGCHERPTLADRASLPYTQATIYEILRIGNAVPFAAPHAAIENTYVGEYFIPKGTTVVSNLYSCHNNPKYWPDPHKFDPTRFINSTGSVYRPEGFMPFGVGKRMCIGDILVQCELFLFLATILQEFDIKSTSEDVKPSPNVVFGTITKLDNYEVRFLKRENNNMNLENREYYSSRCC